MYLYISKACNNYVQLKEKLISHAFKKYSIQNECVIKTNCEKNDPPPKLHIGTNSPIHRKPCTYVLIAK